MKIIDTHMHTDNDRGIVKTGIENTEKLINLNNCCFVKKRSRL